MPLFFWFMALELSYGHILISTPPCRLIAWLEMRKMAYLTSRATNQKNKGTLFSSTLKVGKGNVSLFFWFVALKLCYGHILISMSPCRQIARLEMTKTPYLSSRAINQKNKGTLLSSTFKIAQGKVPLLFSYLAQELRYWVFFISYEYILCRNMQLRYPFWAMAV